MFGGSIELPVDPLFYSIDFQYSDIRVDACYPCATLLAD